MAFMWSAAAFLTWSQFVTADELPDCKAILDAGAKMGCLESSITVLQKMVTRNAVQMGGKAFGQNEPDSPDWALQLLAGSGPASWTSPPIGFAHQFATKPAVFVALAGIKSGANADTDLFGFSAEATDITETGLRVTIRRTEGALYGVMVNWLAYGAYRQ